MRGDPPPVKGRTDVLKVQLVGLLSALQPKWELGMVNTSVADNEFGADCQPRMLFVERRLFLSLGPALSDGTPQRR